MEMMKRCRRKREGLTKLEECLLYRNKWMAPVKNGDGRRTGGWAASHRRETELKQPLGLAVGIKERRRTNWLEGVRKINVMQKRDEACTTKSDN